MARSWCQSARKKRVGLHSGYRNSKLVLANQIPKLNVFFYFYVTGDWTQGLTYARQVLHHWAITYVLFRNFWGRVSLYCPAALEHKIFLPQPPAYLGLQMWACRLGPTLFFLTFLAWGTSFMELGFHGAGGGMVLWWFKDITFLLLFFVIAVIHHSV